MKEKIIGDDIEGEYVCDPELVRESIERMANRVLDGEDRIDLLMDVASELPPEMFEDKLSKSDEEDPGRHTEEEFRKVFPIPCKEGIFLPVEGDNSSFSCVSESEAPNETGVTPKGPPEDLQNLQNSKQAQQGGSPDRGVAQRGGSPDRGVAQRGGSSDRGVAQRGGSSDRGVAQRGDSSDRGVAQRGGSSDRGVAQQGGSSDRGVAQRGDSPDRGVAQQGGNQDRGVAQQLEENSPEVEGVLISLHDYRRWFAKDKSKWSIYREIRSFSFPFPLSFTIIGGQSHYFVEISDPEMIKAIRMNIMIEEKIKPYRNKLMQVRIRIPREHLKLVKLIVPGFFHYDHFIKFAESAFKEESDFPQIRLYKGKVEFVRTAINLLESDYKKFLQVAENNYRSISDVVMAFLESYVEAQYRTILDKGSKKGGKDGNILPAGGEAEAQ